MKQVNAVNPVLTTDWIKVDFHFLLILSIVMVALGVVYAVGLEAMPFLHDSLHDVRHASGFPCH